MTFSTFIRVLIVVEIYAHCTHTERFTCRHYNDQISSSHSRYTRQLMMFTFVYLYSNTSTYDVSC